MLPGVRSIIDNVRYTFITAALSMNHLLYAAAFARQE